ncbi:MAG: hypothetical protein AMJ78_03090 [Omnitrophica WOR_2 bacterium SM23_29]|nr:MAG: hypothetical protein AMJ78_03090 [Omnitrophica WOR_2 bacterium SM23_29]
MIFKLLLLYIITLPLMKAPNLPFLAQRVQFSEVVFLFLFFFWMKALIKNKRLPQDTGLSKPILIFLIFCLLSFFNSNNLFLSSIELLGLIYLFIMFVLVADIVDNRQKLDKIIKVWIGTLVAVLAFGFLGWLGAIFMKERNIFCEIYKDFIFFKPAYRVTSTFRITQGLGNYLVASLGFVVSELLLSKDKNYKLFLKFVLFFMCLIEIVTFSRSIISFAVVCLLIYDYFHKVRDLKFRIVRFLSAATIIIIFLVSIIFISSIHILSFKIGGSSKGTHKQLVVSADYAYDPRGARKIVAWEMVKNHPFLGVGLAMFPSCINKLNNENYFKKILFLYMTILPVNIRWMP